ncbi:hypothetical protein T484DRAFT_1782080 [Baffinella frigidus]|nr:hypothetical protein T484DRAFT_1782080 [Cryptophyta sp. CCMP2293]
MANLLLLALSDATIAPATAFLAPASISIRHAAGSAAGVSAMGLWRAPVASVAKRSRAAASLAPRMVAGSEVIIQEDFRLAAVFLTLGLGLVALKAPPGLPVAIFGAFLLFQTTKIRFALDDTAFELKRASTPQSEELINSGENIVVGGANRWDFSTFVNYDFFPSKDLPILVYFKETQTPEAKWGDGPGKFDDKKGGQIHFFPAICNVEQLNDLFIAKGVPSERYNPK